MLMRLLNPWYNQTMTKIPPLKPHEGSWVVVDKVSGLAVTEVFKDEKKYLENLNSDYYIETIGTYLARVGGW